MPRVALLLLLALCSGCALRPQPVELRPHLAAPRAAAPEGRARLAVGRFEDARSRLDRSGVQPPLELRWFGLGRQGPNRTGNAAFIGEVAEGARRDAAVTLAASGAFSEVALVDLGDADGERGDLPAGYDRLLVATVESLAGTQQQDSVLSIAVIGWLRTRYEAPQGQASLHYRLYGPSGLEWETTIDTVHVSPRRTIAEAAVDALSRANERFAEQLYEREVPLAERQRRRIPGDAGTGAHRAARAGGERCPGAHLRNDTRRAACLLASPRRRGPGSGTSGGAARSPFDRGHRGRLRTDGRRSGAAVRRPVSASRVRSGATPSSACLPRGEIRTLTIVHELAHLYGAVHVQDRSSVMHPVLEFDARFFDPLNLRILRASADRPFGAPLPRAMAQDLLAIYRAAESWATGSTPANSPTPAAPSNSTFAALGLRGLRGRGRGSGRRAGWRGVRGRTAPRRGGAGDLGADDEV